MNKADIAEIGKASAAATKLKETEAKDTSLMSRYTSQFAAFWSHDPDVAVMSMDISKVINMIHQALDKYTTLGITFLTQRRDALLQPKHFDRDSHVSL